MGGGPLRFSSSLIPRGVRVEGKRRCDVRALSKLPQASDKGGDEAPFLTFCLTVSCSESSL